MMMQRCAWTVGLALLVVGCGGGGEIPDGRDKQAISRAAVTLAASCISGSGDESSIEDQVTVLLREADEAGDEKFTLSETFSDVTMAEVLEDRAEMMRERDCSPGQRARLEEAG